jgi:hypothetical protein
MSNELKGKILQWMTGETGVSSEAIAYQMAGIENGRKWHTHPGDPDDFKRCLKLVNQIPEIRPRLDEMRSVSPSWNSLIDHWQELEACFMEEVGEWLYKKYSLKSAPKTYAMMRKIYGEK